jgi:hypothetical protein
VAEEDKEMSPEEYCDSLDEKQKPKCQEIVRDMDAGKISTDEAGDRLSELIGLGEEEEEEGKEECKDCKDAVAVGMALATCHDINKEEGKNTPCDEWRKEAEARKISAFDIIDRLRGVTQDPVRKTDLDDLEAVIKEEMAKKTK